MQARNQLLAKESHIWTLRAIVAIQFVFLASLFMWSKSAAKIDRVYVPKDLQSGSYMRINNPNEAVIYQFGLYILQQIYRWRENGLEDYPKNIYQYQYFITPQCRRLLEKDVKRRQGEISGRVRSQEEILGRDYIANRVHLVEPGKWRIWYDLMVHEAIGAVDMKHLPVQWPMQVVRYDIDPEKNEWGLALDCQEEDIPVVLNIDLETEFKKVIQ